jgi:hypothetical protein
MVGYLPEYQLSPSDDIRELGSAGPLPLAIEAGSEAIGNFRSAGNNTANVKVITVEHRLIQAGPVGTKVPAPAS